MQPIKKYSVLKVEVMQREENHFSSSVTISVHEKLENYRECKRPVSCRQSQKTHRQNCTRLCQTWLNASSLRKTHF